MSTISPATVLTASNDTTDTITTAHTTMSARRQHPVRRATLIAAAAAGAVTTAFAAVVHAAGVSFEIDHEQIPVAGFTQMVVLGSVIGGIIAATLNRRSNRARRQFLRITAVLTVLSCLPSVALPQDTATKVALVVSHLLAAAVAVPVIARRVRA